MASQIFLCPIHHPYYIASISAHNSSSESTLPFSKSFAGCLKEWKLIGSFFASDTKTAISVLIQKWLFYVYSSYILFRICAFFLLIDYQIPSCEEYPKAQYIFRIKCNACLWCAAAYLRGPHISGNRGP